MQHQIVITLLPEGLKVEGPIHDRILCYGMLELAKEIVSKSESGGATNRIVPAPAGFNPS